MRTTIGVISDIHLSPPGTPPDGWHNPYPLGQAREMLARAIARCAGEDVDAVVLLGDLTHTGDLASLATVIAETATLDRPVHVLPGNHDFAFPPREVRAVAERNGGARLTYAPAAFAVADGLHATTTMLELRSGSGFHAADLPRVPRDAALVVFTHFPALPTRERVRAWGLRHAGDLANRAALAATLAVRERPTIVVHGHLHVRDAHATGAVLQLGCAALIEPPHELAVIEIAHETGGELTVRRRAESVAAFAPELRLPVMAPETQTWRYADGAWATAP